MRRNRPILFVAILAGALIVISWALLSPGQREPVYQGKTLSQWLEVYDPDHAILLGKEWEEANAAIRNMDTNAIPFLLQMLQARDSELKLWFVSLARKQHLINVRFIPEEDRRHRAEAGLMALGPRAENAVPGLFEIYDRNHSVEIQEAAVRVLTQLGPPGKDAVPALLRQMSNTNVTVRQYAVVALGRVPAEPEVAVPAFTKALEDPESSIRVSAAMTLGKFGPAAKAAVPALLKFIELNPPHAGRLTSLNSGDVALESLRRIDGEAAEKVMPKLQSPFRK